MSDRHAMIGGAMRPSAWSVCAALCLSAAVASAGAQKKTATPPPQIRTLTGCIVASLNDKKVLTLSDSTNGATYWLTGTNVRDFIGKHVTVSGGLPKRFRITTGLYPSPNVAAQAGDIDPTRAAIAAHSGTAAGSPTGLPEFRVKSVRSIPGVCPEG
jgi:hypothetical protein